MGTAARLAQLLRDALRAEEPREVEELLWRGADPNLVLPDGAAAIHLAAGARHPRGLHCLGALLRRGGDPNARSSEAQTPLHVAAAWGCLRGLELLLSQGADPALRDEDGLRALDLAEQQGHRDCARVLGKLDMHTRTPAQTQEPDPKPGGPEEDELGTSLPGHPDETLDSTVLQTQFSIGDSRDKGLEAASEQLNLPEAQEAADKDGSLKASLGLWDSSSEASFVTAVEASGAEDSAPDSTPWAKSLPHTMEALPPDVRAPQRVPKSPGTPLLAHAAVMENRELSDRLQALTLSSTDADDSASSSSTSTTSCPAWNPPQQPPLGLPDLYFLTDDQTSLDSDVAALWLTEDEEQSTEGRDPVPTLHTVVPAMSDLQLLQELRVHGQSSGPIKPFTRRPYLQRLEKAKAGPGPNFAGHSPELAKALRTGQIPDAQVEEDALARQFERPDPARKWREGVVKSSFTYLLLDPRETQDLPSRAFSLTPAECLQTFVRAIFYVGKGTRARPDAHLWEALGHCGRPGKQGCAKVRRILDIWASGRGVVSLHCFQHVVAVEAYTREACLVDALGIQMLTNQKQGHYYGVVAGWPPTRRRRLGVHLLHRALLVFLAEGERELRPQDLQARG